jgi:hypothetical protein
LETLERRAFTEGQVSKIHELKGFFNTKFVYFFQMCSNSMSNSLKQNKSSSHVKINFFIFWKKLLYCFPSMKQFVLRPGARHSRSGVRRSSVRSRSAKSERLAPRAKRSSVEYHWW